MKEKQLISEESELMISLIYEPLIQQN